MYVYSILVIKTGIVSQAKGSAYIELGNTKVVVSAYDPREIPNRQDYSLQGEIYCDFKYAPFSCIKRRLYQQDAEEKHCSSLMKQALESAVCRQEFPNYQVDIYAIVLQNDGSCLSAAIMAAGLALAHAGVPMYDIITSVTVGIQKDTMLLDPTSREQSFCEAPISKDKGNEHGTVVFSFLHTQEQISQFYQCGYISVEKLTEAIDVMKKACGDVVKVAQKSLVKHVFKTLNNQQLKN